MLLAGRHGGTPSGNANLPAMMVRLWWFVVGVCAGAWGTVRVLRRIERARAALTPAHLVRSGALTAADLLDAGGARLTGRHN